MNLKKRIRGFFTLTRKADGGFTLVELIVVIAILAILSGIAVPAYSGYIEKANTAADEQLLASLNTAFAAACNINGEDNYGRSDTPKVEVSTEGEVANNALDTENDGIDAAFATFFEGGTFKLFKQLAYDGAMGQFNEGTTVQFGAYQLNISKKWADAMQNNTFSEIGAGLLTGKVDKVSDIAALLVAYTDEEGNAKGTFANLVFDESGAYLSNLQKTLGMDDATFAAFVMDENGFKSDVLANSLVLTAAQKTQGMDTSFLGETGSAAQLRKELDDPATATEAMAKLALTYGMYTSYVQNTPGMVDKSEALLEQETFTGMTEILQDIESPEFQAYLAGPQGQADLNAYMASMSIINNSAGQSVEATKDILTGGFNDPELVAALNGLMNPSAED